jgi:hypothetical protein
MKNKEELDQNIIVSNLALVLGLKHGYNLFDVDLLRGRKELIFELIEEYAFIELDTLFS